MAFFNVEKVNNNNNTNTFFNQNPNMYGPNGMDSNMMNQQQGMMNQGWGMDQNMMQQPMQQPMMDPNMGMQQYNNNMVDSYQPMNNYGMNQNDWSNGGMMPQQPMMNQPMFNQPDYGQNMTSLDNSQPMMNQPMMNQPMEPNIQPSSDTFISNVPTNNIDNQQPMMNNEASDSFETLGENNYETETLQMPQIADTGINQEQQPVPQYPVSQEPVPVQEPVPAQQPIPNPEPETLGLEASLPREVEKETLLDNPSGNLDEQQTVPTNLNPLDNGNNPIPVNPIIAQMEKHQHVEEIGEQKEVKANLFAAIGIILGMIIKPGTTMLNNAKRFKEMKKAISIMIWLAVIFLVICIGVRVGVGSFDRTYSSLTDSYKLVFNPARIFELSNYVEYIIIAVSISLGGVLLTALIYYASSFLNSKGVHFATYLVVSNLGLIPFICGVIVLCPVCMIFSTYLGLGSLIFTFLCSLITLLIGMNEVLRFRSVNSQIFYHVINLSVITLIALIIFTFMIRSGWVILPNTLL